MQQLPGLFHPMYDGVEQPVLFLQNGKIAACNPAAQRLQLQPGDEARALLPPELSFEQLLLAPSNVRIHLPDQNIDALTQPVCGGLLIFLPAAAAGSDRIAAALSRAAQAVSSPLTSLLAVTSGIFPLLADAEDPVLQQNLAVLLRACYQLLRVSDNLTDLSSSLQGQLPLSLERTDLTDYLDTLCQDAQMLCRQTGRQLDVQLPLAPVYAWVDRRLLQRALLSLLSNAIKFSAPESTIQLVFSRFLSRSDRLRIAFKLLRHIRTHLIAILTDTRTYDCADLLWFRPECLMHGPQHAFSHSSRRPAPAGMRQPDCAVCRIEKIQRDTVRKICHKNKPRLIRYQSVYVLIIPRAHDSFSSVICRHPADVCRVRLMRGDHILRSASERVRHAPVILLDTCRIVSPGKAQIHRCKLSPAHAALPRCKEMPDNPCLFQKRKGKKCIHKPPCCLR